MLDHKSTNKKQNRPKQLTLLVSVVDRLALSDGDLGSVLGTIAINVQNQPRVVDVRNEAVLVEPVLVLGFLSRLALPLNDSGGEFEST